MISKIIFLSLFAFIKQFRLPFKYEEIDWDEKSIRLVLSGFQVQKGFL